jgi:hypothetical protein
MTNNDDNEGILCLIVEILLKKQRENCGGEGEVVECPERQMQARSDGSGEVSFLSIAGRSSEIQAVAVELSPPAMDKEDSNMCAGDYEVVMGMNEHANDKFIFFCDIRETIKRPSRYMNSDEECRHSEGILAHLTEKAQRRRDTAVSSVRR